MYSIVLIIASCAGIYLVHVTFEVSFEASLNAFSWVRHNCGF